MENWNNFIKSIESSKNKNEDLEVIYKEYIPETHIFKISPEVIKLLSLTKNKPKSEYFLPFDVFFIDCRLEFDDETFINGFLIHKSNFQLSGNKEVFITCFLDKKDDTKSLLISSPISYKKIKEEIKNFDLFEFDKFNFKNLELFFVNFLDFLNNPEIEFVTIKRSEEQNQKRLKRGKLPIPIIDFVRVTGKLKIYLDELKSGGKIELSHRFWVRGHFRTLRNPERWKYKVGTKIWIAPFIKGLGLLITKTYELKTQEAKI